MLSAEAVPVINNQALRPTHIPTFVSANSSNENGYLALMACNQNDLPVNQVLTYREYECTCKLDGTSHKLLSDYVKDKRKK